MERFCECLDEKLVKDKQHTDHEASVICGSNEQTVDSYVYGNLSELNKYMQEKGVKPGGRRIMVKQATITKEFRGLVVDPPGEISNGLIAGLFGLASLLLVFSTAADHSTFTCSSCGTRIDMTRWTQPTFSCPRCRQPYMRQQPQN
jgi:hypothetical protein